MAILVLLYSSPLHHALVGALGALICYCTYMVFGLLFSYLKKKTNGSNLPKRTRKSNDKNAGIIVTERINTPKQETHFCMYCGKPIGSYMKYCPYCGKEQTFVFSQDESLNTKTKKSDISDNRQNIVKDESTIGSSTNNIKTKNNSLPSKKHNVSSLKGIFAWLAIFIIIICIARGCNGI